MIRRICLIIILGITYAVVIGAAISCAAMISPEAQKDGGSKKNDGSAVVEVKVVKLDASTSPDESCISFEGFDPRAKDNFTACAQHLFQDQVPTPYNVGTNNSVDAANNLHSCVSAKNKKAILVGHGGPGWTATGNGPNPSESQELDSDSYRLFRDLKESELILFSCWTGSFPVGKDLVNNLGAILPTRAQNGPVFCGDVRPNVGLYVLDDKRLKWIIAKPKTLFSDPPPDPLYLNQNPTPCVALKKETDGFEVLNVKELTKNGQFEVSDYFSSYWPKPPLPPESSKKFHSLQSAFTAPVINKGFSEIGFCTVLPKDYIPGLPVTGGFKLTIRGETRMFDILGDAMAYDHKSNVYYFVAPSSLRRFEHVLNLKAYGQLNKANDAVK